MVPWRAGVLNLLVVAMSTMSQMNCDVFSDPATRLEECLARAVKAPTNPGAVFNASCDLKMTGRYTIVLHPAGYVTDDELVSAGLAQALVPEVRALRLGNSPAMYVIASDRTVTGIGSERSTASSRSSRQSAFVQIGHLMVVTRNTQPVTVEIGRPYGTSIIQRMR